jgi:hypothetical protein
MTAPPLLFGPYSMPPFRDGDAVIDEARGEVVVCGLSSAPIPWPLYRPLGPRPVPVLCGVLADAVRREPALAVASWWGVSHSTVAAWRKASASAASTRGRAGCTPRRRRGRTA